MSQEEIWRQFPVPPAPVVPPEQALSTFTVPEGFRVELVASEPLVGDPVEIEFDADGRLWVVEMRGYMPNPDGIGETAPIGRIVVLEDLDADGRMDRQTVFLDRLVMPRALAVLQDGILVAEPPNLWLCCDLDGDLRCDERQLLDTEYATQNDPRLGRQSNPEHASNGLLWGMDNWLYSANHRMRYRYVAGEWLQDQTISRGQWGISQDNYGRLFYNTNSDHFRGDLISDAYLERNANSPGLRGTNVRINPDQSVWPGRITLGVNRGYRSNTLRSDGTLARFTGACGTLIYRGSNFPNEYEGDGFVCEPTGNLIRRNRVTESNGVLTAVNAYENGEFLTSTDERFRPVNLVNGPGGALYVVDLYRGLIQHRIYLTTFLRKQVEERGLAEPTGLGRIYRVVYQGRSSEPQAPLSRMAAEELVRQLRSKDGWRRDTAQRLLVERQDRSAVKSLRQLARRSQNSLARIHALWTLHGLRAVDRLTVRRAMASSDPKVRIAAIRTSESLVDRLGAAEMVTLWRPALDDIPEVQWQAALSLGELEGEAVLAPLKLILERNLHHPYIADSVLSGLSRRELEFLASLLDADGIWETNLSSTSAIWERLSAAVFRGGDVSRIHGLLHLAAAEERSRPQKDALLRGMHGAAFKTVKGRRQLVGEPIAVAKKPEYLERLANYPFRSVAALADQLTEAFHWPGKEIVSEPEADSDRLTPEQVARFEEGAVLYQSVCGTCHQPDGLGQEGLAPPLLDSDWVLGSQEKIVRIVLHGLDGPIEVKGQEWNLSMPGLAVLNDDQISGVITYVRREWGHRASPVDPATVKAIRDEYPDRFDLWTVEELNELDQ